MKLLPLAAVVVLAAVTTLAAGAGASPEMPEEDMLMMSLMGGGIEAPSAAEAGLSAPALGLLSTESVAAPGFRSIDVPGALHTRAFGVNAVGEIVGSYTDATGTYGFLWRDGDITTIAFPGAVFTEPWGINPQGDIVGRYRVAGDTRTFGFLLSDGVYTDISAPGRRHTLPTKISASEEIVGCVHDVNILVDMLGYVQRGDRVEFYEPLAGTMHNGVTRGGGLVAGLYFETLTKVHGYVLDRGVYAQFDYPGATFTQAWDVSPNGTVVGYFNAVDSHGFTLDANGFTQIDVPGASWTRLFGINPQEDMVGVYADASNRLHGFLLKTQ